MRIDPPPSPAPAIGTIPAATAEADPPDEPPLLCFKFHGFRHAPQASGSVIPLIPNSGVFVRPKVIIPAFSQRLTISALKSGV
jgi:hypothetical protein